jgi:hypothetical protein
VIQHAITSRVVEGKIQQLAARQSQHRGREFLERVRQAIGAGYDVGDLKKKTIPIMFGP